MTKINKEVESGVIEDFSKLKLREISKKYAISQTSIYNICKKYSIKNTIHKNRKYTLNENYFEVIDTEDKAYFLGLLYADGSVNPNNNTINITLQARDKIILDKFKECINSNKPLYYTGSRRENWQPIYRMSISSVKLFQDVQKQGCFINKTYILKFPTEEQVPKHLVHHFIRGYFDGDGCISGPSFNVIGTFSLLIQLQTILVSECGLIINKIKPKHKTNNIICTLLYSGIGSCNKIERYMYRDATIYLSRKKEKFERLKFKRNFKIK